VTDGAHERAGRTEGGYAMELSTRDAARLLKVSEATLLRWIRSGDLPAHRSRERYWLNEAELLEWAGERGAELDPSLGSRWEGAAGTSLADALATGGIHHRVPGGSKEAVLRAVVERLPLAEEHDPEFVLQVLLAREALGSTGIGDGIAIPHVRNPLVLHVDRTALMLCFLEQPVEYGSVDGRSVDTLFTLVTSSVRAHLHVLSRLSFALRDPAFRQLLRESAPAAEILETVRRIDAGLTGAGPAPERSAE